MSGMNRALVTWGVLLLSAARANAGTVTGKLDLPDLDRPPVATKGFLDRTENALAPVKPLSPRNQMVIVLEGEEKPVSPPQVVVELLGETSRRRSSPRRPVRRS